MAADQVTAAPQMTDVGGVEEGAGPYQVGHDEEVTPPAARAQRVADGERAPAAVVEREQQMATRRGEIDIGDEPRPRRVLGGRDRVEVAGEPRHRVLEGQGARALKARAEGVVGYVVVAQTRDLEPLHGAPRMAACGGRRAAPFRAPRTERYTPITCCARRRSSRSCTAARPAAR